MKLRASEAVFLAICLLAAVISLTAVYIVRGRDVSEVVVVTADSAEEEYDVSVINNASAEDFMRVSGIGEVKAGDIIAYRTALGGFKRASQLKDVAGISDALYLRIIEYFYLSAHEPEATSPPETSVEEPTEASTEPTEKATKASTKKTEKTEPATTASEAVTAERVITEVDINSATAEEISQALLIEPELAEEIVALREKIHYFSSVQELYLCDGMTNEIYRAIKDFVIIG